MVNSSPMGPSSDEKVMAGFAYVGQLVCFIPTIAIFFIKKEESDFIKFHCLQSFSFIVIGIILFVLQMAFGILGAILGNIPGVGALFGIGTMILFSLVGLAITCYWIYIMVKVFMGDNVQIPILGPFIEEKMM